MRQNSGITQNKIATPEDRPARDSPAITVIVTCSTKAIHLAAKVVFSLRLAFHDILGAANMHP
jgi:hypothetical protein